MFAGLTGELGTLGLGLVIAGVVSGVVTGMLGAGGGLVIVPVLYQVFGAAGVSDDLRMHLAIGTSLAAIIPTSLSSLSSHLRKGEVDRELLNHWAAPLLAGVLLGAVFAGFAPGEWLMLIFGVAALALAVLLVFGVENRQLADQIPRGLAGALLPFGIGSVSTIMGIGGRTIGAPAMTLFGMRVQRAAGTAPALCAIISIAGAIGAVITGWGLQRLPAYSYGYVNLLAFAVVAPVMFVVAPLSAHFAPLTDRTRLRRTFALFVAITAAKLLWDALA
jgi:uncharacterized membrane protein YfcA